nr:hypothetical protein [Tanacetum cinerariifolium]
MKEELIVYPMKSHRSTTNIHEGRMNEEDMFGVNNLDGNEVVVDVLASEKVEQSVKVVENKVSTIDLVTTTSEVVTTAGIEVSTVATTTQISKDELTLAQTLIEIKAAKPKAKGIMMQEPNCELAARLQEEEREELTIEKKSWLFVELMDKRKKHFARCRAKKNRSKPPTKDQKRNQMCTYLKNMANYKHN